MTPASATDAMNADQALVLAEFARACKAAARAVSLYPGAHPAIRAALDRVTAATVRLIPGPELTLVVHPGALVIDGRAAARPDPSIGELAGLLHDRLVGELRIERDTTAEDWRALLLLLARAPEELIADGGLAKAWIDTGRGRFHIREIDYAEVLRERGGGSAAEWDRIIACCLSGGAAALDDRAIASLLSAVDNPQLLQELMDRLQAGGGDGGPTIGARAAALLQMLHGAIDAASARGQDPDRVLEAAADNAARLTPEMLLALAGHRGHESPVIASAASGMLGRMKDDTIASIVATSVATERGATERLAQAFEALVPEDDRKDRLLDLAHDEAQRTELGQEEGFEHLWLGARDMLLSYSDTNYVSDAYARELSSARRQAVDVERVSDDPPERVHGWLATVSDTSLRQLDLALLRDLLRIETDPGKWAAVVNVVVPDIERRTLLGDFADARELAGMLAADAIGEGRPFLAGEARKALDRLAAGPLARHIVLHFRKVEDQEVEPLSRLCHAIGPPIVRPLAEALAVEENKKAIRRLRELLLGFGAAGRQSVEQLKNSPNPAVRRMAIDLLRVFGGSEALPELASMLGDSDPQVQREAIRAIVQIATTAAYEVLQRALVAGGASRETVLRELLELHDDRAIPLLCYVLDHTRPRGKLAQVHAEIIDALGGLSAHQDSTRTLRRVLYEGDWWAPLRTAGLRKAAAVALRRLGSREAAAILQEAATQGSRGVRNAARAEAAAAVRRERERA